MRLYIVVFIIDGTQFVRTFSNIDVASSFAKDLKKNYGTIAKIYFNDLDKL